MWPYVVVILPPILIQHLKFGSQATTQVCYRKKSENAMKLFWWMLLALLILRHESIGRDLAVYDYIFDELAASSWPKVIRRSPEFAWSIMNKLVAVMGGSFRWVIILSAVLSICWIGKAYVKYTLDTALTIALFIIMSNFVLLFSGLRQSIAISLGFWAFELVRNKKFFSFILVTVLAVWFHTSAFMLLFMYPLYYLKVTRKWLLFVVPILLSILIFNRQIFAVLGLLLNEFTDYDATITQTGSITMLILFVMLAVLAYVIPEEAKLDADTLAMRNFLLLSVVIQMFAPLHTVAMRMGYYYMAFIPLLLPRIISCRSAQMTQIARLARHVMLLFFLAYFFYTAPKNNVLDTFPYYFWWQTPQMFSGF